MYDMCVYVHVYINTRINTNQYEHNYITINATFPAPKIHQISTWGAH